MERDRHAALLAAMDSARQQAKENGIQYDERKYLPVKDRLTIFRETFGAEYGIDTNVYIQDGFVIASAKISDVGLVIASGHAMVRIGADEISSSAPVEACETFAIGRALACLGLHGGEYASAQEMERIKPGRPMDNQAKQRYDNKSPGGGAVVGGPAFFVPEETNPESIRKVFDQIDRINTLDDLSAYYGLMQHILEWVHPEDKDEIIASFRVRRDQLKEIA